MNSSQRATSGATDARKTKMNGNEQNGRNGRRVIGSNTLIPLGLVGVLVFSIISAVFWLDSRFDSLEARMVQIELSIGDRWTSSSMKLWSEILQRKNPETKVPDPWEIVKHRK